MGARGEFIVRPRAERRDAETRAILALRDDGYRVEELTPYQFRINRALDLYPTGRRWHNLKTGRRGSYDFVAVVVSSQLERI